MILSEAIYYKNTLERTNTIPDPDYTSHWYGDIESTRIMALGLISGTYITYNFSYENPGKIPTKVNVNIQQDIPNTLIKIR